MTRLGFAPGITTDEYVEIVRLTGTPIRVEPYNNEASRDTIRHYAYGIGDDNPLYCDPSYAGGTPFGDLLAPPSFLYSVFDGAIGAGLPGVQPIYAGTSWVFERRVRRGDEITVEAKFGGVKRVKGRMADDIVIQDADSTYRVGDTTVATAVASTFRIPRSDAPGGLKYEAREQYVYSDDEIEAIRATALNEFRRGPLPLVVDELAVGDLIPPVVKGPIDRITMTAYYAGCIGSPGYKACEIAWKYRDWADHAPENLPSNYDPTYFAETVLPSIGHQDPEVAREIGMPNAYDNGPQRCGWFAHAVTNWMGDAAFLKTLDVRLRRPDIFGDTVWIAGSITAITRTNDSAVVELELWADNQLGDRVATGHASVLAALEPGKPVLP